MKTETKRKQKLLGVAMITVSLFFAWRFKTLGYENWFLILSGIIPGIYAVFTKERMIWI